MAEDRKAESESAGQKTPIAIGAKAKRKSSVAPKTFRGRIVAGVLIIIPLAVTAILVRWVYEGALAVGAKLVNIIWKVFFRIKEGAVPDDVQQEMLIDSANPDWIDVVGAVGLTVLMLYLLGWLGTNVVGRRFIDSLENLVKRIPLVATVYNAIKTMVQALSGGGKRDDAEQQVVLIDFPHENMKAVAFMTNQVTDQVSKQVYATVYLPTTPNPTSGYMLMVPEERITKTDWTMEEALSMVLSGGAAAKPVVHLIPPKWLAGEGRRASGHGPADQLRR